jgi:hypothetical protein
MAEKKAFLLRIDPALWAEIERLAQAELRSANAQVEFLLRDALGRRGAIRKRSPGSHEDRTGELNQARTAARNFPQAMISSRTAAWAIG